MVCHGTAVENLLTQEDCHWGLREGQIVLKDDDGIFPQCAHLDSIESLLTPCVMHRTTTLRDNQLACSDMGLMVIRE